MVKHISLGPVSAYLGASLATFSIGISFSRTVACIDLGFIWLSLEF